MHYSLVVSLPERTQVVETLPVNRGSVKVANPEISFPKVCRYHRDGLSRESQPVAGKIFELCAKQAVGTDNLSQTKKPIQRNLGRACKRTRKAQSMLRLVSSTNRQEGAVTIAKDILIDEHKSMKIAKMINLSEKESTVTRDNERQTKRLLTGYLSLDTDEDFTYEEYMDYQFGNPGKPKESFIGLDLSDEETSNYYARLLDEEKLKFQDDGIKDKIRRLSNMVKSLELKLANVTESVYGSLNGWYDNSARKYKLEEQLDNAKKQLWEAEVYRESLLNS